MWGWIAIVVGLALLGFVLAGLRLRIDQPRGKRTRLWVYFGPKDTEKDTDQESP